MLKNYLKIAWRSLGKNKKSASINIGGLSVGMCVAILIGLWIWDELSFNQYHHNYDRIAQVYQHQTWNGKVETGEAVPFPLGEELRNSHGSNFKYLSMASWEGPHILSYNDKHFSKGGIYAEKDFPEMLTLEMAKGTRSGLSSPNTILLSASVAKAFFGAADPINQVMRIDNKLEVKVTGVYKDLPFNTRFNEIYFIAPWDLYKTSEGWLQYAATQWGNNSFQLFAQIADNTSFASVNQKIVNVKYNKVSEEDKKYKAQIFLHPMSQWHLYTSWTDGKQAGGQIKYVWLFSIIGMFVLLLACINFMNLSTARSEKRAREVGIRKTVGSLRMQLITQFFMESVLVAFVAFVLALLLSAMLLPWFNDVAGKKMQLLWTQPVFWLAGCGFTLLTGIIAGSYPALFLSSFKPVKVLKGTFKAGRFASLPRKILVVVQFSVSVALIIGTIIVYQQIQHTKNRPVGYDRNGIVMINMMTPDFYGKYDVLRAELKKENVILEMAESSSPLNAVWSNSGGFYWEGKDPGLDTDFATLWVTHDFGKTVGFELVAGRDFSRQFATDTGCVILNEAAVKFMNIKDPVGKTIKWENGNIRNLTIVGIVKNMVMSSPYAPVKQAVYLLDYGNVNWIFLKLNPAKSASQSIATIEKVFKRTIPNAPFDYKFADLQYAAKFAAEERVGKLAAFFTILAIFISCLGLFGLASFVAEQRTKEVGIRKIVGASVFSLWKLLSRDFVMLVGISCLAAIPLSYYYLSNWLQNYEYQTPIHWWVFALSAAGAITITLITVSFQAIKAARTNPVKSLRSE